MEEKRIPPETEVDLDYLEGFLEKENLLLLKGRGIKDSTDEVPFHTKVFFQEVGKLSKIFASSGDAKRKLIMRVADRLEKNIPEMLGSLDYRGDDIQVAELYRDWIQFLSVHGLENKRLIETITEYGGMQIHDALQKFQFGPAFAMFQFSVEKMNARHISKENEEAVRYFLKENGIKAVSSYASSEANSLSRNIDYTRLNEGQLYKFTSYAEPAIKTYEDMLRVMAKSGSSQQLLSFTLDAHRCVYEKILNAKKGTFEKRGDAYPEQTEPDYSCMVRCVKASMDKIQLATKDDPENEAVIDFVIDNVPSLMDELLKNKRGTLAFDLYERTVELNDPESQVGFIRAFGGKYAAAMRPTNPIEVAHMMLEMREALKVTKDDILILTDPESPPEAPIPIAILSHASFNLSSKDAKLTKNRDMVMFREAASDVLVRDSNVKNEKFEWLNFKNDFVSHTLVQTIKNVHHTDYFSPLTHPSIKHHGQHLHSCSLLTLMLRVDF